MKLNLLRALKENFRVKVFTAFTLLIFVISASFTSFIIHRQSKFLTDELIKDGKLLANVLANNSRLGVFSENKELIKGPVDGIFQHAGVLEVSVFNLEGKLLKREKRPGIRTTDKSIEGDGWSEHEIFDKIRESVSPLYHEGNSRVAFWSPVISGPGYSAEESLFFGESPLQRKDRIIGFVGISIDKGMLNEQINDSLFKSILMGIAFLLIGSGVTYIVVKGVTKPLNRLTQGVKTLGTEGVVEKIPVETGDEIGKLAMAFNNMSESLKSRERALRKERDMAQKYLDIAEVMLLVIEADQTVSLVNKKGCEILGCKEEEIVGKNWFETFLSEGERDGIKTVFEKIITGEIEPAEDVECPVLCRSGDKRFIAWHNAVLRNEEGKITAALSSGEDITERKLAREALERSREQLRALARRLFFIREEERKQIAREIHDELGGALTGLKIDISTLVKSLPNIRDKARREALLNRATDMMQLLDKTIHTVRRMMTALRPSILDDFGLIAALEWQLQDFQKRTGSDCEFISTLEDIPFDQERSTAVFRIFQESLTNVARHAKATKVTVKLSEEEGSLRMDIKDNGRGIRKEELSDIKSMGILGMRERVLFLGGTVNISGSPREGTTVNVKIPLESR